MANPANQGRYWHNIDLMLGQRRRRWTNINSTLCQYLAHAGCHHINATPSIKRVGTYSVDRKIIAILDSNVGVPNTLWGTLYFFCAKIVFLIVGEYEQRNAIM